MTDLVERARQFATAEHQRIDHRRKYSQQPYHVHLEAVAALVASISEDQEMIAAAWLHDTVEDTTATSEDIEREFGTSVAALVEDLTDVSKPGDGNRAVRKEIDRQHSARASVRAKTVKLADLIDNCKDITRHDPRFARVYLSEMGALLEVLQDADPGLLNQARELHAASLQQLGLGPATAATELPPSPDQERFSGLASPHFRRLFTELFTAGDIAEPLLSFDIGQSCNTVSTSLTQRQQRIGSIRDKGAVCGYVRIEDLVGDSCTDCVRTFNRDQLLARDSTFADVIHVLVRHDYCFVEMLGEVTGVISRDDINKPMVRMWLFGIVTMVETELVRMIERYFPNESWQSVLSPGRLEKALQIQAERQRRNQQCHLIDCLQLSDKGQILLSDSQALEALGFKSRRATKHVIKEIESLRNHLAHAQDIVTHDWAQIARMTQRMEELMRG